MSPLVVVASTNPVKIEAVERAFARMFPHAKFTVEPLKADSGVSSQPLSDEETLQGAHNRVSRARKARPDGDYWVGIEGGVADSSGGMTAFAWMEIQSRGQVGRARTASFYLPEKVAAYVRAGMELGKADDLVFGQSDSKRKNGAVGLLTGNTITRTGLYEHALVMALIPFRQPSLYPEERTD